MTFQDIHNRNLMVHPDKPALVFHDRVLTFKGFNERVNRLTNALRDMGVKKGERLAILSNGAPQYVVLKDGFPNVTEEDIIGHCKKHLAGYKKPKVVAFVESLPKSPAGKILRRELKRREGFLLG